MAWTVQNVSTATIQVLDVPDQQSIAPGATASFQPADFLASLALTVNVAQGALCVISYGNFTPIGQFAPITYQANGPAAPQTQSGASAPFSLAPFTQGLVLLNLTALSLGAALAVGFSPYDGTSAQYPSQSVIAAQSAVGALTQAFAPAGIAGRLTWTLTGSSPSATFALLWQVR